MSYGTAVLYLLTFHYKLGRLALGCSLQVHFRYRWIVTRARFLHCNPNASPSESDLNYVDLIRIEFVMCVLTLLPWRQRAVVRGNQESYTEPQRSKRISFPSAGKIMREIRNVNIRKQGGWWETEVQCTWEWLQMRKIPNALPWRNSSPWTLHPLRDGYGEVYDNRSANSIKTAAQLESLLACARR